MDWFYLGVVVVLFLLAISDLFVGVSNDAVNFLNSAIGARVARFKTIIIVASIGVFAGAALSNGMMDIARHGIFQPEGFTFRELMSIFLAVMITDIILLDLFNSFGLPTSTTVSMVFELLGATVALALVKMAGNPELMMGSLINTEKALSVIIGIFVSVAIAFFFGTLVQFLTRLIFGFDFKRRQKWFIGLFGGLAITAIIYFMCIKGLKHASFMTHEMKDWISVNTGKILWMSMIFFTILSQILYWLKVNVWKVVVLVGTFALAMAFAGNDLVNFIGVPLAGFDSYLTFRESGVGADALMMDSLNAPANTPMYFLLIAGAVMVYALATSRKARHVVETTVGLSKNTTAGEDEMFNSSAVARTLTRHFTSVAEWIDRRLPSRTKAWIDGRFDTTRAQAEEGAAFDLVRASVNLVLAGLLIALGTSLKLPLSTTYVTFMVAMGSSLADRAWGRESAVFRITGVLSVVGGWFLTAFVAFIFCALMVLCLYFGGWIATILMLSLAVYLLIVSQKRFRKREEAHVHSDAVFNEMMSAKSPEEAWLKFKLHYKNTMTEALSWAAFHYENLTSGFMNNDLKALRKTLAATHSEKVQLKKQRKKEMLGLRMIDPKQSIRCDTWFHLGSSTAKHIVYYLKRMAEPCLEHIDNNFQPLPAEWKEIFIPYRNRLSDLMQHTLSVIDTGDYLRAVEVDAEADALVADLKRLTISEEERSRRQNDASLDELTIVYLNLIQDSEEITTSLKQLLRANRKFQG